MKLFMKKLWKLIKTKCWYIILLVLSSTYVWCYRFDIYELKELNARNLIFILWLILLLLPLFSEMKFLGVKIKKEVQKETEEVKGLLQNLQTQVNQLQLTNSVANNINLSNATLPSEQKIEELLQRVTELQASYPNSGTEVKDSVPKGEDKNVYLFKVRLDIETSLRTSYVYVDDKEDYYLPGGYKISLKGLRDSVYLTASESKKAKTKAYKRMF